MYLDILILFIFIIVIIKGLKDGLLVQFFSIFGFSVDLLIAQKFTPLVMNQLNIEKGENNYIISYLIIFLLSYAIISIVVYFIKVILRNQSKGVIFRLLGGGIGFLKGVLISIIVLIIFNYVSQKYPTVENYGVGSKANDFFLENNYYIKDYFPKEIKNNLRTSGIKKTVENYFNKIF